ncbi:MAG: TolC family protein [bacterium]
MEKNSLIFAFLPQANIEAKYQWLKFQPEPEPMMFDPGFPGVDPIPINFDMPDKSRTLTISVVQPITPLWSVAFGYKAAEAGHDIFKMQKELAVEQIKLEVITLYYNYQMLSESMVVLAQTKEQLQRYKEQAENFVAAGLADRRAILKIEIEQAKIEQQIQMVESNTGLIKKNLSLLMNVPKEDFELEQVRVSNEVLKASHDELEDLMISNRLELKIVDRSLDVTENQKMLAAQPFIPTLAIAGGYSKTWDASQFQPEGTLFIGGVLSWDIGFNWLKAAFDVKKAEHEHTKAIFESVDVKKMLGLQLLQLENDIETKSQAIEIANKEVASATENLRIEEDKYKEKLTTETELLDASIALRAAKMNLLNSLWEHRVALHRLAATIGVTYKDIVGGGM